jgi:Kef-type K+ transport system membrane component KefB
VTELVGALGVSAALPAGAAAAAAAPDADGRSGLVVLGLALLVLAAKAGGVAVERWGQPSVLGELAVGVLLANVLPLLFAEQGIAFVRSDPTLRLLAEIGVLILLFDVGLESDLRALWRVGTSAVLAAVTGVVVPFALGWATGAWLLPDSPGLVPVFLGATLTATSVGITVRVLRDLGEVQSREGRIIVGAAILDDVLGLIVLAVVGGLAVGSSGAGAESWAATALGILARAVVFLALAVALGHFLSRPLVRLVARTGHGDLLLVVGLALCLGFAYLAERIGLADIIGAFAAGLMLDPYGEGVRTGAEEATLSELLGPLGNVFVPLFFVLTGLQVDLVGLAEPRVLALGAVLIVCAVAGKLAIAAGVLDRSVDRLAVAIGMVPRGEVGLLFASIGAGLTVDGEPLLTQGTFSAVILMVLTTTLVTPPGLRWAFGRRRGPGRP